MSATVTPTADTAPSIGETPTVNRPPLRRRLGRAAQYGLMILIGVGALFPLFWMIISSLKTAQELQLLPPTWWPISATFAAYQAVFEVLDFGRSILNSVIIAGGTTISVVVTSIMAGYVFAKYKFRGRDVLFYLVLATLFLPPIVTLVPLFRLMQNLGLIDSYLGVMLPNLANAFGIFLMRQFIAGIPDELIEAARVDGASEWRILWRVIAPLSLPAVATLTMFAFVFYWNAFLWPLTILQSEEMHTVVLSMNRLVSYTTSVRFQNVIMAGATISILPSLALFAWMGRHYVRGMFEAGLKG